MSEYKMAQERLNLFLDWLRNDSVHNLEVWTFGNKLLAVKLPEGSTFTTVSAFDWLTIRAKLYYKVDLNLYSVSWENGSLKLVYKYYAHYCKKIGWE